MFNSLFGGKGKIISAFSFKIANELERKYPPDEENKKRRRVSEKRMTRILETCFQDAIKFKNDNNLGVYGVAKLINSFRWDLDEKGYDKAFVELAAEGLKVYLTRKTDVVIEDEVEDS